MVLVFDEKQDDGRNLICDSGLGVVEDYNARYDGRSVSVQQKLCNERLEDGDGSLSNSGVRECVHHADIGNVSVRMREVGCNCKVADNSVLEAGTE